ncbi:MAG: sugar ABC transporter ATP-binding protein [Mesorhizobium sp.]|uniref:sugar ABC transporter ATP-binding protein n=1 Tax=Mesorhizobium sp. TaxID=1871066 RepID=UPI0012020750|nr:sugar ABC transporter ATP-binding protein [Mesorhizobium sp.]TIM28640.1 MAG: sugar ABC transporter ATP-binding protein [Mesorhizobium sp.]
MSSVARHAEVIGATTEVAPPIVKISGATKRYGPTVALNGLSLSIKRGESHAIIGRNGAGKSTLVALLTGLISLDSGALLLNGKPPPARRDRRAWREAVACVYQHRTLVPHLSVAENLYLGGYQTRSFISWPNLRRKAAEDLESWDIPISPETRVSDLSVGEAQMVEIARALSQGSRFVILDEPTAQLVSSEIDHLLLRVNQLRERGVTFMFISHHLDEVPRVCDAVSVLRNGRDVLHGAVADLTTPQIVAAMVGDQLMGNSLATGEKVVRTPLPANAPVALSAKLKADVCQDTFELNLHAGEVVGLAGHSGSGTRQLALALAGHNAKWAGQLEVAGKPVPNTWNARTALSHGVSLLPEDRIQTGLVANLSIEHNITLPHLKALTKGLLIDVDASRAFAEQSATELGVACSSVSQKVGELSGGNQQKVMLGAVLSTSPSVLILLHPTAGVDIASKATILESVEERRRQGLAVIVVSDEPEELAFCDRVQVWVRGRCVMEGSGLNEDELVAAMEGIESTGRSS